MKTGFSKMKCGLLGEHLGHSFSPLIHKELADYSYSLCEVSKDGLDTFMKNPPLDAFNVTIPYKQSVIPYLDFISPKAKDIGAVNTVVKRDGKLYGFNTDYFGFEYMINISGIEVLGKKALVFGAGGASLTACTVLRDKGAASVTVVDIGDNNPAFLASHSNAQIIVNTTPVGMFPKNGKSAVDLSLFPDCEGAFDVIFNPARTEFVMQAEELGIPVVNGLPMLVAQAARAFEFFTDDTFEEGCIEKITDLIGQSTRNIVLIGMPACGKSTVGKILAEKLGRDFFDADIEFKKMHSLSPADAIKTLGEDKFRELEHLTVLELGKHSGCVIACGGGVVTRECNYKPLHQNGVIIFLERDLDKLTSKGRPISQGTTPQELYSKRIDSYNRFADFTVKSTENPELTAAEMEKTFKSSSFSCVFGK